jgi:hypothetical protein
VAENWTDEERAELHALRDLRQLVIGHGGDDFTIQPWISRHRRHDENPYIGCPFCRDKFGPLPDGGAIERGAKAIQAADGSLSGDYAYELFAFVPPLAPTPGPRPRRNAITGSCTTGR